ncbi:cupin domain-containing protein [Endozoicomonas arenosclerae]|uniref:cupin domain-containing protein n=1 Tax=Endozoicomonas arenosclerae TaxID=1633495 RepID=UPI000783EEB9|nr:cupin domain-containing protein [Endozoicomonas arenosclerae]
MKQSILGSISPAAFLESYWQKKPLLIRNAIPDFQSPLSADELAGLALEEEVESRIVLEKGLEQTDGPWQLKRGPFTETDFSNLPPSHWTLLVQAVDHWVPEVHSLLDYFDFLPSWRLEDIMISYATDGGSVGPHYDHFDVFLIQAEGKRRWQVGPVYDASSPRLEETELHILSEFEVVEDYVLEPGDMLYLPPGVGHHGAAEGECMTISVGFRAPSHREILMQFTDFIADQLPESLRYSDPDQTLPAHKGEIDETALDRLQAILKEHIEDRALLSEWFGEMMTQPKHEQPVEETYQDWAELKAEAEGIDLLTNEGSRLAFKQKSAQQESLMLFVDGESYECKTEATRNLALKLCESACLEAKHWSSIKEEEAQKLIMELINMGSIYPDFEEDFEE